MITKYPNDSVTDFYKCTEEIATILDTYFGREHGPVSDMSDINTFVEEYVNGWGITARSYGADDLSRETQQEFSEVEETEDTMHVRDSMYHIDEEGKPVGRELIFISFPEDDGSVDLVEVRNELRMAIDKKDGNAYPCTEDVLDTNLFQIQYDGGWAGNGKFFKSLEFQTLTKEGIIEVANNAIEYTENYHHIFLESLIYKGISEEGNIRLELSFGS